MTRLGFVRRGLLSESRSFPAALSWSVLAVLLATAARLAIAPWVTGLPFLTFFPAVLIVAVFLGPEWGLVVVIGSALAANFFFGEHAFRWAFGRQDGIGDVVFACSAGMVVATAAALRNSVREMAEGARREAALNIELQHRVKNNLAVVQGLARQTAKAVAHPDQFYEAFHGRLIALADAHDVLSSSEWKECRLRDLVRVALKPFAEHGATIVDGPPCIVPLVACVPLVLAIHELGTNALKYGALSAPTGRVSLSWTLENGFAVLRWQEAGGPPVVSPKRRGLGSRLLSKQAGLDAVSLDFASEGVICEIKIRGAKLTA